MKPKFETKLGSLLDYYHSGCSEYNVKIYVNDILEYKGSIQCADLEFGHYYLRVIEFFRDDKLKTIRIYTKHE